ncbi:hypothetical protein [Pasteuria penetrans]|nr:hypothetical protein [Pasteuria penetrans]
MFLCAAGLGRSTGMTLGMERFIVAGKILDIVRVVRFFCHFP